MNLDLWVTWIAVVILVACIAFGAGGAFPSRRLLDLDKIWRDGYEQGCDDTEALHAPCDREHVVRQTPWPDAETPPAAALSMLPWTDDTDHLAELASRYYEPLTRGAGSPSSGANSMPATTAPWPGADGQGAPKGDSPGSGPCPHCGCEPFEGDPDDRRSHERHCPSGPRARGLWPPDPGEFPTSPVYDQLAAERAAQDPPPPVVLRSGGGDTTPGPALTGVPASHQSERQPAGPGADDAPTDMWDAIAAALDEDPEINLWSIRAEQARCKDIVNEIRQLARALEA